MFSYFNLPHTHHHHSLCFVWLLLPPTIRTRTTSPLIEAPTIWKLSIRLRSIFSTQMASLIVKLKSERSTEDTRQVLLVTTSEEIPNLWTHRKGEPQLCLSQRWRRALSPSLPTFFVLLMWDVSRGSCTNGLFDVSELDQVWD
jgi:hypothetical protein